MLVQLFLWEDCPLILAVGLPSHYLHWDGWLSDHGVLQVEISRGYDCETNQMILVSIAVLTMKIWTNTAAITCKRKTNVQTWQMLWQQPGHSQQLEKHLALWSDLSIMNVCPCSLPVNWQVDSAKSAWLLVTGIDSQTAQISRSSLQTPLIGLPKLLL